MTSQMSSSAADVNVERMREFARIQALGRAVDALVGRQYAATEKERALGMLEAHVTELEKLMESVEASAAEAKNRCAVLRADTQANGSGALAGTNPEVLRLQEEYGEAMMAQLLRHWERLEALQRLLTEA